jgi:hypothetical protein
MMLLVNPGDLLHSKSTAPAARRGEVDTDMGIHKVPLVGYTLLCTIFTAHCPRLDWAFLESQDWKSPVLSCHWALHDPPTKGGSHPILGVTASALPAAGADCSQRNSGVFSQCNPILSEGSTCA